VIASHYAEPLDCKVTSPAELLNAPSSGGELIRKLDAGEPFAKLDDSLGWAWGYGGAERRVGYVRSECLGH
jgi:hypothetical protein